MSLTNLLVSQTYPSQGTMIYNPGFKVVAAANLLVQMQNTTTLVSQTLNLNSDYTVTNVGVSSGCTVTLSPTNWPSGIPIGYQLVVTRQVPLTQGTSFANEGAFLPSVVEAALDFLTMICQQQQNQLNALVQDPTTVFQGLLAESLTTSQGQGLVAHNPALSYPVGTLPGNLAGGSGGALVGLQQPYTGTKARTLAQKTAENVSGTDFTGADITGATDSTAAIQAALYAWRDVTLPEGTFKISGLTMPSRGGRLRGASQSRTILIHTGTGAAITCNDSTTTVYGFTRVPHQIDGQWEIDHMSIYTNGPVGIQLGGSNPTSMSHIHHLKMMPTAYENAWTGSTHVAGTSAISINNDPWGGGSSSYKIHVDHCDFSGYAFGATLSEIVNAFTMSHVYMFDCLAGMSLSPAILATSVVSGNIYTIISAGSSSWTSFGNAAWLASQTYTAGQIAYSGGVWWTAVSPVTGTAPAAGAWTSGATAWAPGTVFTATATGTGSGTVIMTNMASNNDILLDDIYFEFGEAGAQGVVFGPGGGYNVSVRNCSFELVNASGTQHAYNWNANGTWGLITATGCRYLIAGDNGLMNGTRHYGTIPAGWNEYGFGGSGGNVPQWFVGGTTSAPMSGYQETTTTPTTISNLTVIGTPTFTLKWRQVGNVVYFTLRITSTTSTASTANSTAILLTSGTNAPPAPASYGTCQAVGTQSVLNLGVGCIYPSGACYTPTWAANADVTISGFYFTT